MRAFKRFLIPVATLFSVVAFMAPASAAPGGTIDEITNSGCTLMTTVTFGDAGTYWVEIWDEGEPLDQQAITTVAAGETHAFSYEVRAPFGQGSPGVTVSVRDSQSGTAYVYQNDVDFRGSKNCGRPPLTLDPSATTEPPTTEAPTTEAPTTEVPTTVTPTTATPTTVTPGPSVAPATGARPQSGKPTYTG